jgi:PAS domain S-box-containing protein
MACILVVDDEKSVRVTLKAFLEEDSHVVYTAENAVEALKLMDEYDFDVILSDIVLPHTNGMKLLKEIRKRSSDVQIIMITGEPTVETATEAMRSGVFDYLAKPVAKESVKKIVAKAAQIKALKDENRGYREHLEEILEERARALLESEEKYRSLIENINVGIFRSSTGLEGKFIEANPATIKMFGFESKENLLSIKIADMCENPGVISNLNKKVLRDRFIKSEEIQLKRRDGTPFTGSLSGVIVVDERGEVKYFDGIIEDVTERKKMENRLHSFATILQDTKEAVIIQDLNGQIIAWDSGAELMYGWSEEEAIGMNYIGMVSEESRSKFLDLIKKLKDGLTIEPIEAKHITKDGKILYTWLTFTILKDEEGAPYAVATTEQDITKRKQAEQNLSESEERYRTMIEALGEGVVVVDSENKFTITNPAAEKIFGVQPRGLIGRKLDEFVDEANRAIIKAQMESRLERNTAGYEIEIIQPGGKKRILNVTTTSRGDGNLKTDGILSVFRDITEIRQMEEEMLKADKLESIGLLAGGIAHDFNNILTIILGNLTFAKMFLKPGGKIYKRITKAERASFRAKDLTQQFLTFAKGGLPVKKVTSIADLIMESVNFSIRGSKVKCEFSLQDDLWPLEIDEGQINQVINNLIINATQAMPEGGRIKIKAENVMIDSGATLSLKKGKYVKITVEDEGVGISTENMKRIFDPYFTTKEKGNGLGLCTSFAIIKKHDGLITAKSELGKGTKFYVYLPASKKGIPQKEDIKNTAMVGSGKILLLDDDEEILEIVGSMLKKIGYSVKYSRDGSETIELYKKAKKAGKPFDIVIMDLTIPGGMGGKEAIDKLIEIDPKIKAVASSGYSNSYVMSNYRKYGFSGVITKPYRAEDLNGLLQNLQKQQ